MIFTNSSTPNARAVNPEKPSNRRVAQAAIPDELHFFVRQLFLGGAPTCSHVMHILSVSAKVKMLRVYAQGFVAFVQHMKMRWNRNAVVQLPRQSMDLQSASCNVGHSGDVLILLEWLHLRACPNAASISKWFALAQKPLFKLFRIDSWFAVPRMIYSRIPAAFVPSHIMSMAPSSLTRFFVTAFNRTEFHGLYSNMGAIA